MVSRRTSLTVLMEPGRIKRGLGADPSHEPAIVAGRSYSLVVEAMGQTTRQAFRALDPVLAPLDEASWRLDPPVLGQQRPLLLQFDRVMDAELCSSEISVVGPSGELLPVSPVLGPNGRMLRIGLAAEWTHGEHRDVCGNRLGEALDHSLGEGGRPRSGLMRFNPV